LGQSAIEKKMEGAVHTQVQFPHALICASAFSRFLVLQDSFVEYVNNIK